MINENNPLAGHSVLLVESPMLTPNMYAIAFVDFGMSIIRTEEFTPRELVDYMNHHLLECAIIHTGYLPDEAQIIEAHEAGKKIVVIKRNPPGNSEVRHMYQQFEQVGIPTTNKGLDSEINVFALLSTLFQIM